MARVSVKYIDTQEPLQSIEVRSRLDFSGSILPASQPASYAVHGPTKKSQIDVSKGLAAITSA